MGVSRKALAFLLAAAMLTSSMLLIESSSAQSTVKPDVPEFKIMLVKHDNSWLTVDLVITNQNLPEQKQDENYSFYTYDGLMFNVRFKDQYTDSWSNISALNGPYMPHTSGCKYTIFSLMLNNMRSTDSLRGNDVVQGGIQVPLNSTVEFQVEAVYGSSYWCVSVPFGKYVFDGQESGWSSTQSITINEADAVTGPFSNPTVTITTPTPQPTATNTPTPTSTASNQKMDSITRPLTVFAGLIAALAFTALGLILLYRRRKP